MGGRFSTAMILVACVATASACTSGADGVDIDDFASEMARAYCEADLRCGLIDRESDCGAIVQLEFDPRVYLAVEDGSVDYEPDEAERCLAAIAELSCDAFGRGRRSQLLPCRLSDLGRGPRAYSACHPAPDECARVFSSTRHSGEGCYVDEQCHSGLCTVPQPSPSDPFPDPFPTGCNSDFSCCEKVCEIILESQVGGPCDSIHHCVEGAVCPAYGGPCMALKREGEACDWSFDCEDGLACYSQADEPRACHPLPEIGAPCARNSELGECNDWTLACESTSDTCQPALREGEDCSASPTQCGPLLHCDSDLGRCISLPRLGEDCSRYRCLGAAYCDEPPGETPTCTALKADDAPCQASFECESQKCNTLATPPRCESEPLCLGDVDQSSSST